MILDDLYDDHVQENNMGRIRTIKTETCIITFKRTDPYGFWYISLDKGQLPENLRGAYSTFDKAFKDIDRYIAEKRLTIVAQSDNEEANPIDRESLIPVLKTKKVKSA
jgi:hypothetical protein